MKLIRPAAFLLFTLFTSSLFAGNGDLIFMREEGSKTFAIILNLSSKTCITKGKNKNGSWIVLNNDRIASIDNNSAYMKSRNLTEIKLRDGYSGYLLSNDLSTLKVGNHNYSLVQALSFVYQTDERIYKYIINPNSMSCTYWTSDGTDWQKLSELSIHSIKNEGQTYSGIPVFSLYLTPYNPNSELLISTTWDKIMDTNNHWFYRSN